MLEHQKKILQKLSYDEKLFKREILKSFRWLKSYEIILLHEWLLVNFGKTHRNVINDVFEFITA
jgi:hypothetical protein